MAGLSTLSDDLILLILLYVPNDDLLSVTTVSRNFHRCSTPQLYRYIYLWESYERHRANYSPPRVPDWRSRHKHLGKPPSYATRIFDSSLFLRTVSKSDKLRSYVVGASITCRPDQEEAVFPMIQLLRTSLSSLHLKCTLSTFHRNRTLFSTASCFEVEISERDEIYNRSGDLQNSAYKEDINSYFDLPNIQLLSLRGIRSWNLFTQDIPEKSNTSNITSLCLTSTVPADPGLRKLLSWPKALKSFRYELQLSEIYRGFFDAAFSALILKEFSHALRSQERSLEELFIYGDSQGDCSTGFHPTEPIDLHLFTNLKYVGLPLGFLFISQDEARYLGISISPAAISKILPPTLEGLQIEILDDYNDWSSYFSPDPDNNDGLLNPGELSAFICEIAKNKATQFIGLRSIILWQPAVSGLGPEIYTLEGEEGCEEVVEACKAAKIHICWDEHYAPPLFS